MSSVVKMGKQTCCGGLLKRLSMPSVVTMGKQTYCGGFKRGILCLR